MLKELSRVSCNYYGIICIQNRNSLVTKDKEKLQNINDAMATFDEWLNNFEKNNLSKENRPYLPLAAIESLLPLKEKYKIENNQIDKFLKAYKAAKADYKNLRTVASDENQPTWDIVRNTELKKLLKNIEDNKPNLWDGDLPTKEHLEIILWAYSPDASKIKKNVANFEEKLDSKDKSSDEDEKGASKRKSDSSEGDEESPKKKSKSK